MVSTISAVINGNVKEFGLHVTTPEPFTLQKCLRQAADAGSKYMVLEVTSHALDQHRVFGIPFTVSVLTNITREHFDYHKTYENYVSAKVKLLEISRVAVVNMDDESYKSISNLKSQISNVQWVTYGMGSDSDINPNIFPFKTKLLGEFNRYNILAAIAVCRNLGISDNTIQDGITNFKLPVGRMEVVHEDEFTVMIDFAHTPNALKQVLTTTRSIMKNNGRLIHVFGSAGERDKGKRSQMGEVSNQFAHIIILTADDPRSESVEKISDEIAAGITSVKKIHKIPDRQEAINEAIKLAAPEDFVVITGIGHVRAMPVSGKEIPWSEHEAVAQALKLKVKNEK